MKNYRGLLFAALIATVVTVSAAQQSPYLMKYHDWLAANLPAIDREQFECNYQDLLNDIRYKKTRPIRKKRERLRCKGMRYLELNRPQLFRDIVMQLTDRSTSRSRKHRIEMYLLRLGYWRQFVVNRRSSEGTVFARIGQAGTYARKSVTSLWQKKPVTKKTKRLT